jgi:hypothetical protein
MERRPRVLVIGEAANPEWASVPLVGWSLYQALSRVVDAHLVTHVRNRPALIRAGLIEGKEFTSIDNEYVARPLYHLAEMIRGGKDKGWTTLQALSSLFYYFLNTRFGGSSRVELRQKNSIWCTGSRR